MHHQFQRSKGSEDPLDAQLNAELTSALNVTHGRPEDQLKRLAEAFRFDTARALMKELQSVQEMKTEKEPALDGILGNERGFEQILGLLHDLRILFPQEDLEQDDPELKKLQVEQRAGVDKSAIQPVSDISSDKGAPNIPDDFKCPISLDLMRDPVIIATGQVGGALVLSDIPNSRSLFSRILTERHKMYLIIVACNSRFQS